MKVEEMTKVYRATLTPEEADQVRRPLANALQTLEDAVERFR